MARQYKIREVLETLIKPDEKYIVLQGEIIGKGIQDNKYKIDGYKLFSFNLFSDTEVVNTIDQKIFLSPYEIPTVPLLERGVHLKPSIPEMVEYAKGNSTIANIKREGIVCRNYEKNISFKVINPTFLLEYGE